MSKRRSRVHPNYKTRYRVRNWHDYDRALRCRGDITIWLTPAAIAAWTPLGTRARGGQRRYSDTVIETALTLRMVFGLAWRQTEGLLHSILSLMGLELEVPDHTTLSRRTVGLKVELKRRARGCGSLHLVVDSTGVGLFGEGAWAAARWGGRGRRGWRKLHLGVDADGNIVAAELTDNTTTDAKAFPDLVRQVRAPVHRVTADGAYDRRTVYQAAHELRAHAVIPPARSAVVSGEPVLAERDAHIEHIALVGRRRWRVDVGQHHQARAENTFYRYKSAFGGRLKARNHAAQRNEVMTGCNILNRFAVLGMPVSERIGS